MCAKTACPSAVPLRASASRGPPGTRHSSPSRQAACRRCCRTGAAPRRAHKLSDEVVEALRAAKSEQPELSTRELVDLVRERFGLRVHRRSIERALARGKKTRMTPTPLALPLTHSAYAQGYEQMRRHALEPGTPLDRQGLAVMVRRGIAAWLFVSAELPAAPAGVCAGRVAQGTARQGREAGDRHSSRDGQSPHGRGVGMSTAHQKVSTSHLSRHAYLYVRQSTPRQVYENGESTLRQYALRERAVALGWPTESIVSGTQTPYRNLG